MPKNDKPIFFDPTFKRWPRVKTGLFVLAGVFTVIFGALLFSIVFNPSLRNIALPQLQKNSRHHRHVPENLKEEKAALSKAISSHHFAAAATGTTPISAGFLVTWDPASFDSFRQHIGNLNMVIAEWLHTADSKGGISEADPASTQKTMDLVKTRKPDMKVIVLINNYRANKWQGVETDELLVSKEARTIFINNLLQYVDSKHAQGVTIDFEDISRKDDLYSFTKELADVFHARGLMVGVNVPSDNESFDYARLASVADYLNVMMYDQHWPSSVAGPISGIDWFTSVLQKRSAEIPASKMLVSLGNYAYDWQEGKKMAESETFSQAVVTAKESEGDISLDSASLNPQYDYYDDNDVLHHVWMLDAVSFFDQLAVLQNLHPFGVSLWRLGSEDPALWNVFGKTATLDQKVANSLSNLGADYSVVYQGQGEILSVEKAPEVGHRDIHFDVSRGIITDENYITFASPYVLNRYGAVPKKIALTFDDGPDPTYTPEVLKILKEKNAAATFFVIGSSAERYPELVKQEFEAGYTIGNHTFTHPNIAEISDFQLRLELSSTEHLIASLTGRDTHLFRAPYAIDVEPDSADQVRPIATAATLGYLSVGMQLDPQDWSTPGVDKIVSRVVNAAEAATGNIVLLHDGGGDRAQTIEALPEIIDTLRADGFTLVSVEDLIGKSRDDVMTPTVSNSIALSGNTFGFQTFTFGEAILSFLFALGIVLGLIHFVGVGILAFFQKSRRSKASDKPHDISTAVIIPSYNEAKVVVRTVESLLASIHPTKFRIIVVDDGSTDNTLPILKEAFGGNPMVTILGKENGGKSSALNFGFAASDAEIFISLDADTLFTKDTVDLLIRHFADPRVGAVAGNTKVGNRVNLLTRWQALEYITSQNLDRRAFELMNGITVVPGAVGAWRREALEKAGGWPGGTLAEDSDLTLAVRSLGYKIVYEENALALTEAPETLKSFLKQRFRWTYGTLQVSRKYAYTLFNPKYGWLGFLILPYMLLYQVIFPFLGPVIDLIVFGSLGLTLFERAYHPSTFSAAGLERILFFYALFLLLDFITAGMALFLERDEDKSLLVWLFFQRFFYRQLMYYVAIKSVFAAAKGGTVGWNKLERQASVTSSPKSKS